MSTEEQDAESGLRKRLGGITKVDLAFLGFAVMASAYYYTGRWAHREGIINGTAMAWVTALFVVMAIPIVGYALALMTGRFER